MAHVSNSGDPGAIAGAVAGELANPTGTALFAVTVADVADLTPAAVLAIAEASEGEGAPDFENAGQSTGPVGA